MSSPSTRSGYYMLDRMQHTRYDCLRRDMRFLSVVEELTMYAK